MGPNPFVRQNVQIWVTLGYRHEMFEYRDDLPHKSDKRANYGVYGNYDIFAIIFCYFSIVLVWYYKGNVVIAMYIVNHL